MRLDSRVVRACAWAVLAGSVAAAIMPPAAVGQAYPTKPVRIVVPFPPGGSNDILGRLAAERLTERWKQPVVVENRPGATGNIGTDFVAKSPPDGYTLLVMPADIAINPALYTRLPYDVRTDLAPITAMAFSSPVILASPASGLRSIRELLERAKAQPGRLRYGSCGNGTPHHLAMELLKLRAGIDLVHVPYKGCAQAQTAALSGEIEVSINAVAVVAALVRADRLRALAVTSAKRERDLPDAPSLQESGFPDFEVINWIGLFAPAGTPSETIAKIYDDLKASLTEPATVKRMQDRSLEPYLNTPTQFRKMVLDDVERYVPLAKGLGLKLD